MTCFEGMQFFNVQWKGSAVVRWFQRKGRTESVLGQSGFLAGFSRVVAGVFPLSSESSERLLSFAKWLLIVLFFASMISPRFYLTAIGFSRVDLRVEDILIAVLAVIVFWSRAGRRETCEMPAVEKSFVIFLIAAEISIAGGISLGVIDKPFLSLLYLLKWVEYFLVFVLTARLVRSPGDTKTFLACFYFLGIAVALYGYWEHFHPFEPAVYPNYYRLFEREPFHGDANHIGGFFVLWIGFFTGIFLKTPKRFGRIFLLASILFVFFPFIWTYSRKSYFALAGALAAAFPFVREKRRFLLLSSLLVLGAFLLPTRLSERLLDLSDAVTSPDPFHSSWAGNWVMWQRIFWNFQDFFVFGSGLGSRSRLLYESQYVLILAETGVIGCLAFVYLVLTLIRELVCVWDSRLQTIDKGMAAGWLIGLAGILIHGTSCVSLTVVKIAVPFWFLTAFVLVSLKRRSPAA